MTTFSKIWDIEVKPLAIACVTEQELIKLLNKGENYKPTEEEIQYMESVAGKYKDIYGMYYISEMISQVEHALADKRKEVAEIAIIQIYDVLSSSSYFQNVFESNENNEEWKTRAALRDGMYKLIHL